MSEIFYKDLIGNIADEFSHFIFIERAGGNLPTKLNGLEICSQARYPESFSVTCLGSSTFDVKINSKDGATAHKTYSEIAAIKIPFHVNSGGIKFIQDKYYTVCFNLTVPRDHETGLTKLEIFTPETSAVKTMIEERLLFLFKNHIYSALKRAGNFQNLSMNFDERMENADIADLVDLAKAINLLRHGTGRAQMEIPKALQHQFSPQKNSQPRAK